MPDDAAQVKIKALEDELARAQQRIEAATCYSQGHLEARIKTERERDAGAKALVAALAQLDEVQAARDNHDALNREFDFSHGRMRIDLFKSSGKWYATGSVDVSKHAESALWRDDLLAACRAEQSLGDGSGWPLSSSPDAWIKDGYIVGIEIRNDGVPVMITPSGERQ